MHGLRRRPVPANRQPARPVAVPACPPCRRQFFPIGCIRPPESHPSLHTCPSLRRGAPACVPARGRTRAALTFFSVAQPDYHAPKTAGRCRPTCLVHPALPNSPSRGSRPYVVRCSHATHPCMPCHPNPCCLSLLLPYPLLALTHTRTHTHTNKHLPALSPAPPPVLGPSPPNVRLLIFA